MANACNKNCVSVQCNVESRLSCDERGSEHFCFVIPSSRPVFARQSSFFYEPADTASSATAVPTEEDAGGGFDFFWPDVGSRRFSLTSSAGSSLEEATTGHAEAMKEPHQTSSAQQIVNQQHLPQQQLPLTHLSVGQLQEMAQRQQQQIESQQQMLVAKEQRLKYLRQQDIRQQQMASEYDKLRRLREKVEAQELKLRKLRALRGQQAGAAAAAAAANGNNLNANVAVLADLESIRGLFNEKEKELSVAVRKVEELTHQLEDLRSGRVAGGAGGPNSAYPSPQVVELERLRRELTYRKQLNEQQNQMISQQRAQLAMGQDEMIKIDNRILELQERLARKRMMNQQLASQITAATTAKQAQLRAIQQGINKNKNKPVSTVEPFQRQQSHPGEQQMLQQQDDVRNKLNKNGGADASGATGGADPKYQTLPFGTKFAGGGQPGGPPSSAKSQKIEQLKQEKENNNVQFAEDLPPPPPGAGGRNYVDHQGNFSQSDSRPVSSVAPVFQQQKQPQRPTHLFTPDNFNGAVARLQDPRQESPDSSSSAKPKPALPPKPLVSKPPSQQPPPYVPAPLPDNSRLHHQQHQESGGGHDDSSITIRGNQTYQPSGNLSVSTASSSGAAHSEEGTSVDDDTPSDGEGGGGRGNLNNFNSNNVHISINRRIEMPPAFHFPEDQTPPSDLVGMSGNGQDESGKDVGDNAGAVSGQAPSAMYPMMSHMFEEFDQLSPEEKSQIFASNRGQEMEAEDYANQPVPEFESDGESDGRPRPPGIVRTTNLKGRESTVSHNKHVCFDPLALLLDASLEGELDLVKTTAAQVADPSAANDEGITALHNAICAGHFDIVRFLVEFGCDVNAQDSDGWTPLHCAASCNNLPMVRFLVERGACVFATTFSDHETAAEKCEEDEEGFAGCSEYLYGTQERLGLQSASSNGGRVFAVFDYDASRDDELDMMCGDCLVVVRRGDDSEKDWWWARRERDGGEGYIPKNFLGMSSRVERKEERTGGGSSAASMSEGSSEEGEAELSAIPTGEAQQQNDEEKMEEEDGGGKRRDDEGRASSA